MHRKSNQVKMYYFSDRLKKELAQIPYNPLTVVEAPSGFGKTTAVREYLRENLPADSHEFWYTCLGEPATMTWKGICELLANANNETAANLEKLEMPTMDTLMFMMTTIRDFHCATDTYLVIDNFQLVRSDIPRELMSVFSMHGSPNLHMIFITQQLGAKQRFTVHNTNIHTINSSAFFFDREGTASLFRMEGIRLTDSDLERMYVSTEGWISAIRLQIINYEATGSFNHTADIEHLVETAIWNKLTQEERDFLLSVSVMDSFTTRQAAIMMNQAILPENIEELLKYNDFIRYFPDKGVYIIHNILQDYLRNRFYHHQPVEYQKRMLHRAGRSYAAISQYYPAARLFFQVEDYDAILTMPFSGDYLGNQKENNLIEFFSAMVSKCPDEILCRYPSVMLMLAYFMLMNEQIDTYQKLYRLIESAIERNLSLSPEALKKMKGEYELLKAFMSFNDIRKMHEGTKAAWEILGSPSNMMTSEVSWTFRCTSVLFMYWSKAGELENQLRYMDEYLSYYRKLTRGHGSGANSVMRAEAMLMRGEDDEAEIFCHKSLYEARSYKQTSVCLCAELVLARIAILRGDTEGYFTAVRNIQSYAKDTSSIYVLRMVDICMAVVSLIIGVTDHIASWLYDMESIKKKLYAPAVPYAQMIFSTLLIVEKRYNEFWGLSQTIMDIARNMQYVMPQVYQLKFQALAKLNSGHIQEAQEHLNQALSIALPDKIYLPFSYNGEGLEPLYETAKNHISDRDGLNALIALDKRQTKGVGIIKRAILSVKSPLTPREREVALLARDRLSAREIADKLYISEATVKTILKNAYNKLNIHSKSQLNSIEF